MKRTNQEIAREVILGKWGNGEERRKNIEKAGYNYESIQSIVNTLVKGEQNNKEELRIIGQHYMDIEVDLTKYKGINMTFIGGDL